MAESVLSKEERAAMKALAAERRAQAKAAKSATERADNLEAVLDAIAAMDPGDRALAEGVHRIVTEAAPGLAPRTWYGFPAYAKDGAVLCYFKPGAKFKTRYAEFGFTQAARVDDGSMWPTAYALLELTDGVEARLRELLARAIG